MIELTKNYYDSVTQQSRRGIVFAYIAFNSGVRVYGSGIYPADSYIDTTTFPTIVDYGTLLTSVSDFKEGDRKTDTSLMRRAGRMENSSIGLVLNNEGGQFAKIIGMENPLNCRVVCQHGTPDLAQADFRTIIDGRILDWDITRREFAIEVRMQ